jgi:hypothetical protein
LKWVRIEKLCDSLVSRDARAERKHHRRDNEAPEIDFLTVSERMLRIWGSLGAAEPISSNTSFDVSATEWTASDSIADDCVHVAAANFASAIPRLLANAINTRVFDAVACTAGPFIRRSA